ncbi:hypothetical protein [Microbacterium oleivorans]|uniref:hypothetical protein n=1 Tax=Microbacterium TaxID=33882 RepID=UPI00203AB3B0|nr:hypothetical protein [Microbacterium oleivorans]MCM3697262.1 hypothetical protein [Microbacterium oleivorans]
MAQALDAILEIFSWVGFGAAVVFGVAAIVVWASDGSWLPAEAYLDEDGRALRWIDDAGEVNAADLAEHDRDHLGAGGTAPIWYRHGWRDRMRFTKRPPALRMLVGLAIGGGVLGIVSTIASVVVFFVRQ